MSVISLNFFIFFLIIMVIYYLLPGKFQWIWLLLVSIYYYSYSASYLQTLIFILFVLINYLSTIVRVPNDKTRKKIYVHTLIFDILFLSVFKYSAFFFSILESLGLSSFSGAFDFTSGILSSYEPPHISYFALIVIGYITDVYWKKYEAQKNPAKVLLFAGYFPVMTSGPFIRYDRLSSQLFGEKKHFSYEKFVRGLERVIYGIFKKLVISQRCGIIVNTIYDNYRVYPGFYIFIAIITYAFQIYTDFSGLIDIVLGFSECLSIELPENFKTPFFSRSIAEFWRRWHITLGAFLKDYVLFPLQHGRMYKKLRNICKKKLGNDYAKKYNIPVYITLFISWFIIGLWHGGGFNYIFGVGLYMWFIIVLSNLLKPFFSKITTAFHINTECESYHFFQQLRTFFLYIYGLSFFRASSLKEGFSLWKSAFSSFNPWIFFDGSIYQLGLDRREMSIMGVGLMVVLLFSYISEKNDMDIRDWLRKQNFVFRLFVFIIIFAAALVYGIYGQQFNASDFIYGRF